MKHRIKQIIDSEQLTSTKFADIIKVQRSSISHILSGRNNPSLEVVQKILTAFNYLNSDWLLFGKGKMFKETNTEQQSFFSESKNTTKNSETKKIIKDESVNKDQKINISNQNETIVNEQKNETNNKFAEKIIILNSDKTFSEYSPSK